MGGEEFVVILPETDEAGAAEMAKRLHGAIRSQVFTAGAGDDIRVTVSIGCACRPPNTVSPEDLVQAADAALLHAKQVGRDGIVSAKGFGAADRPKWGTAAA